jgi:nicotinate-nucleotide adenylyltransferase
MSKRVGILGGSFNPPHVGHALLAHTLLSTEPIDALWVIPVAEHPFGKDAVSFEHRKAMCELAFRHLGNRVEILEIERTLPKPSYTVQTLAALLQAHPGIELTLIIGSDIIPELPRWREPERLPSLAKIVCFPRQGAAEIVPPEDIPMKFHKGFALPEVSSTEIRGAAHTDAVEGLLDLQVLDYIRTHKLYVINP